MSVGIRYLFKITFSVALLLPGPWLFLSSLVVLVLVWLACSRQTTGYPVAMTHFSSLWNAKIIFLAHCIAVALNLVLNAKAEINIEPWMVTLVFCCVFRLSTSQSLWYLVASAHSRMIFLQKSRTPPAQSTKQLPSRASALKMAVASWALQGRLEQVAQDVWVFLLRWKEWQIERVTPLHLPLRIVSLTCPWILLYMGCSTRLVYVTVMCNTYAFLVTIRMVFALECQFDAFERLRQSKKQI